MSPSSQKAERIRGVILDLDDTLYPEREYLLSGIRAVIEFGARRLRMPPEALQREFDLLLAEAEGRNALFDRLLRRFDAWSPGLAATLVHVYRTHKPQLYPCPDVIPELRTLKRAGCLLGMVTDGPATVQRAKLEALEVASFFDALVFTDDLPPGCRKPSVVPFIVAAEMLGLRVQDCAYVADDPAKDFIGPRELGMRTVRVNRSLPHPLREQSEFPESQEADVVLAGLEGAARVLCSPSQV